MDQKPGLLTHNRNRINAAEMRLQIHITGYTEYAWRDHIISHNIRDELQINIYRQKSHKHVVRMEDDRIPKPKLQY